MAPASGRSRRHLASSPFQPQPEASIQQFSVDDMVSHDVYGLGRVVSEDEGGVTVNFGTQTVRVVSPFRKMEKL